MTRKVTLKHSYAPDDCRATWTIPTPTGGIIAAHGSLPGPGASPESGCA